jgi:uncharacterized protein
VLLPSQQARPTTTVRSATPGAGLTIPNIDNRNAPPASVATGQAPARALPTVGSPEARFEAAQTAYSRGDYTAAYTDARAAGDGGHAEAAALAAFMLERGTGVNADDNAAVALYLAAARANEPNALSSLGRLALDRRGGLRQGEAMGWLDRAISAGRGDAALLKGRALMDGRLTRDPAAAYQAFVRAAALGEAEGAMEAAILLDDGEPIPADNPERARLLMKQAADADVPGAAGGYGLLVYAGRGGPKNLGEAARWMFKASQEGDAEGQFLFALMLSRGEGVARDLERAYAWAIKSAGAEDASADPDRARLRDALSSALSAEQRQRAELLASEL